jgi:hypothetical protein
MQLRTLGGSSLQVAPLCLGGNVFGWTMNEATSFSVLDRIAFNRSRRAVGERVSYSASQESQGTGDNN